MKTYLPLFVLLFSSIAFAGGGRNRVAGAETVIASLRFPIAVDGELSEWDEAKAKALALVSGGGEDARSPLPLAVFRAKVALRYDEEALYAALWWCDPTPLGPEQAPGSVPPGDGLILSMPTGEGATHMAFWREPAGDNARAVVWDGDTPPARGQDLEGVTQGYRRTGPTTYTQELRIPWSALGLDPAAGAVYRIGVELCFGGLDAAAGYKAWRRDQTRGGASTGNRWGGNMGWGFMDGIRSPEQHAPTYDPGTGALVTLMPAGAAAPPNPAVMHEGNEQTRTTAMIAVPAAGIAVDGVLAANEWKPEALTRIASEPTLFPDRYAVDVHWAYDDKGLYAGLYWRTGGPRLNINDPATLDRGYDGGDAIQIRLDTGRVSHIDAWYHDDSDTPAMNIVYGRFQRGLTNEKLPDALAAGARMAVHPLAGGGYTQEIFLPWKLITRTGTPLTEGDSFRVVLDLFFSGLEGNRIPFIVNARVEQSSGIVTLPFAAPADGLYTVVVVDCATGKTVRCLVTLEKMRKGQQVVEWDGLDDARQPLAPGLYEYKGLYQQGIGLKYLMTLNNPGSPPWQTGNGDGEWGGDHSPPAAVAADKDGVYIGWRDAEDGDGLIGCDLSGDKRWGIFGIDGRTDIVAVDGPNLYVANGGSVACLDKTTGYRRGFSVARGRVEVPRGSRTAPPARTSWEWDLIGARSFSQDTCCRRDDYWYTGRCRGIGGGVSGLAARDGRLYVSFLGTDEVVVLDGGDMTELERWPVTRPAGLAFAPGGELYAISGNGVARIDLADGSATPIMSDKLDAPVDLAIDRDGNLYVSQWGAAHCVAVFDPKGNPIRTIGTPGGRPWSGAYDANGMLMPRGIALDPQGRLWVAEYANNPRRVSLWNAASGRFVREFVGGTTYGGAEGGLIDPANPNRAFSDGVWYEIDLAKEGYRPLLTLRGRQSIDDCFAPRDMAGCGGFNIHHHQIVNAANGSRYMVTVQYAGPIAIGELKPDYSWQPSVAIGHVRREMTPPVDKLRDRDSPWPAFFAKHAGETYIWTDANGDGIPQEDEFQWRKGLPAIAAGWGTGAVDPAMNVYGGMGQVTRFAFQGWGANGIPRYDINESKTVATHGSQCDSVAVDAREWVFTLCQAERRGGVHSLSAFDPEGNRRWSIPTSTDYRRPDAISGEALLGPVGTGGEAGEVLGVTQWHGLHVPLVTTDGLLLARLLRDPAAGGAPGPDLYKGETVQYLNALDDGRVILAHGKNAHHFLQVTGLDTVRRFSGTFELTAAQAAQAERQRADGQIEAEANAPISIRISRKTPTVDGNLDDWDWNAAAAIGRKDRVPRAEVSLRVSAGVNEYVPGDTLFVAFKVFKNGSYLNHAKDDPSRLFLTGDAVELRFRADPAAEPGARELCMGDRRLVIGQVDGSPTAVLYNALVPNAKSPVVFRNPAGREVVFDAVSEVRNATVKIENTDEGYVVEAAVPAGILGKLWPRRLIPGDAGIIVADSTGRRVARAYRFNREARIVNDVPSEAALQPENWGVIKVTKE